MIWWTPARPDQTYVESVGLPMTILCNIHEFAPESLSTEAADFLAEIGPDRRWKTYEYGNYNSFKFLTNSNTVVKQTPPLEFAKFTLETVKNAPGLSLAGRLRADPGGLGCARRKEWHTVWSTRSGK